METTDARLFVEEAWERYHVAIRDHLYRMCSNHHLAEDLASETFVRLLRSLIKPGAIRPRSTQAMLRTTARNLLLDHYKSGATRFEYLRDEVIEAHEPATPTFVALDTWDAAVSLLDTLPEKQKMVIVLRGLRDLSIAETARQMGISTQSVRTLRHFANRHLEARRISEGPEGPFWPSRFSERLPAELPRSAQASSAFPSSPPNPPAPTTQERTA